MGYTLKEQLANKENYGSRRRLSDILYIVIHYTANDGDTDENNGKYFRNNIVKASAHYFVDSDSVTRSVPDDYVAYSVGGNKYANCATTGGGKFYGKCTNANSLSVELCDDYKNGTVYPSAATIANALELVRDLMRKYGVPVSHVIRHFDVTGKNCPAYWTNDSKWKAEFHGKLSSGSTDPVPATPGVSSGEVEAYSGYVTVTYGGADGLDVHSKPTFNGSVAQTVKKGEVFTVVGRIKVNGAYMYKLKSGLYITASPTYVFYHTELHSKPGTAATTTPALKMRKGARVKYSGYLYKDSAGNGKGKKVSGTFTVTIYNSKPYGAHLDGLGWVKPGDCTVIG